MLDEELQAFAAGFQNGQRIHAILVPDREAQDVSNPVPSNRCHDTDCILA